MKHARAWLRRCISGLFAMTLSVFLLATERATLAEEVHSYSIRTVDQFQKGSFEGTAVSAAGMLGLAPELTIIAGFEDVDQR